MNQQIQLYKQETDIELIKTLIPHIKNPILIDVGAEKGGFTEAFLKMGFEQAFIFEPLPSHQKKLAEKFATAPVRIFPCALDAEDRKASFHVACDEDGQELDYFHSLNKIPSHGFFKHSKEIPVDCRSLASLLKSQELPRNIGVLKIDTEGNDLKVLRGLGELRPEVVLCEYVPQEIYPEWEHSFADNLVPYAKSLGYEVVIAVQRRAGSDSEIVRLNPTSFTPEDWGNLIFLTKELFLRSGPDVVKWWVNRYGKIAERPDVERDATAECGAEINKFLVPLMKSFQGFEGQTILMNVGALKDDFSKALIEEGVVSQAILFEPNPDSFRALKENFIERNTTLANAAVPSSPGIEFFQFGEDPAKGSLHAPTALTPLSNKKVEVQVVSLDEFAFSKDFLTSIALLKIETQGAGLQVLKGASRLLDYSQPIVVAELIFATLYENQDSAAEIIMWLEKHGYVLAGIFDKSYSSEGFLSSCDAIFIPKSRSAIPQEPFQLKNSPPAGLSEIRTVRKANTSKKSLFRRVIQAIRIS
jgi:FkbM family methyltransferase